MFRTLMSDSAEPVQEDTWLVVEMMVENGATDLDDGLREASKAG